MKVAMRIGMFVMALFVLSGCNTASTNTSSSLNIDAPSQITVEVGSVFVIGDYVTIENVDGDPVMITTDMIDNGGLDLNIVGNYNVTITVFDNESNPVISTVTVHVVDTTKPVVELLGEPILQIQMGEPYVEPGATLTDDYDDGLELVVVGEVDTSVLGETMLEYFTVDASGNQSDSVYRTVEIIAAVEPTFLLSNIAVTMDQISFTIEETDPLAFGTIEAIELYVGDTLAQSLDDVTLRVFNGLLSDCDYSLKVTYTYDLNDGLGVQTIVQTEQTKTVAKVAPSVELQGVENSWLGMSFVLDYVDDDSTGAITAISLYDGEQLISSLIDLSLRKFENLTEGTSYTIHIEYQYDLNDGNGEQSMTFVSVPIEYYSATFLDMVDATDIRLPKIIVTAHAMNIQVENQSMDVVEPDVYVRVLNQAGVQIFSSLYTSNERVEYLVQPLLVESTYTVQLILSYAEGIYSQEYLLRSVEVMSGNDIPYTLEDIMCDPSAFDAFCFLMLDEAGEQVLNPGEGFLFTLYQGVDVIDTVTITSSKDVHFSNLAFLADYSIQIDYFEDVDGTTEYTTIYQQYFQTPMPNFIDGGIDNNDGWVVAGVTDTEANLNILVYRNYGFVIDENNYLEYILYDGDTVIETARLDVFDWQTLHFTDLNPDTAYTLILNQHFIYEGEVFVNQRREYTFVTHPISPIDMIVTVTQEGSLINGLVELTTERDLDIQEVDLEASYNPNFPESIVYETTLVEPYTFTVVDFPSNILYITLHITYLDNGVTQEFTEVVEFKLW